METKYADIPEYNQETQYVVEKDPVDMGDYTYIDLEVLDVEIDDTEEEFLSQ
jgi:hypothetical protein